MSDDEPDITEDNCPEVGQLDDDPPGEIGTAHVEGAVPQRDPYAPIVFLDKGEPSSGIGDHWEDPYRSLGGLARPDAYYGARDFDCPTCQVAAGDKCKIYVERTGQWIVRKMPCISRIKLADKAGLL